MANPERVALVKRGAKAIAEWRQKNPGVVLDLSGADLTEADLSWANLAWADLHGARLHRANLAWAKLIVADLSQAMLCGAFLVVADMMGAKLNNALLSGATLSGANLTQASLEGAAFSNAIFGGTTLGRCDLSQCRGLDTVQHNGPSSIGVDTLIASCRGAGSQLTPELETFFRGAGVPKELLDALPRIVSEIKYRDCFICYGEPDRTFAEKLVTDLQGRGVDCWFYPKDYTPGERSRKEIGEARRGAEKMIVLCSADSLVRDNFLSEIEDQIDEDPEKIIPISLDKLWRHEGFRIQRGNRNLKEFLHDRNYADFSDASKYEESLERLLVGLRWREK